MFMFSLFFLLHLSPKSTKNTELHLAFYGKMLRSFTANVCECYSIGFAKMIFRSHNKKKHLINLKRSVVNGNLREL